MMNFGHGCIDPFLFSLYNLGNIWPSGGVSDEREAFGAMIAFEAKRLGLLRRMFLYNKTYCS